MTAFVGGLLPNGMQQFSDGNGAPYAGGSVQFYVPGTTTPKNTWQDSALTILNTNPVLLDGSGRAIIWGLGSYQQVLYDQYGVQIWSQQTSYGNYNTALVSTASVWQTIVTGIYGLFCFVDATSGGTAVFSVDPTAAHSIYNNITGFAMRITSTNVQIELTSGTTPRTITWSVVIAGAA